MDADSHDNNSPKNEQMNPNFLAIGSAAFLCVLGCHTIVISLACITKIYAAFNKRVLENRVRRLHVQLFRALLIQFSIPVVFCLIPFTIIIFLPLSGLSLGQTGNICSMLASIFPALDPLLMITSISRSAFSFRTTLAGYVFVGGTGRRNEKMALKRSRIYSAIIRSAATRSH